MYDLILRKGTIVDGTRAPRYSADICIKDGRIAKIAPNVTETAVEELDVSGKIVSPGFLDIHSHSDVAPLAKGDISSKLNQGVTFELCGNCGTSVLPASEQCRARLSEYYRNNCQYPAEDIEIDFLDILGYSEAVRKNTCSGNYGMLVGHSSLRCCVMGFENRNPTPDEQVALERLLDEELAKGAFGMSLGLVYPPSAFAETKEMEGLGRVLKKHNALMSVHIRNEGPRVFEAVKEILDIAEHTGVHLEISHLKIMTKSLWGQAQKLLNMIDEARARGVNVSCDQYPYNASSTAMTVLVPKWAHDGGIHELLKRVKAPEQRLIDDINAEMESRGGADRIMIISTHGMRKEYEGKMLADVAAEMKISPVDAVLKLLIDCNGRVSCNYFSQFEEDVECIMSRVDICVGSDGYNYSLDPNVTRHTPHPRSFGTFPHALELMRDKKLLPLEDAVYKMTGRPAQIMGMTERGILAVGKAADITVFDADKVGLKPDFIHPLQSPCGIEYVIVAGEIVLAHNELTGKKPGKVLLSGQC